MEAEGPRRVTGEGKEVLLKAPALGFHEWSGVSTPADGLHCRLHPWALAFPPPLLYVSSLPLSVCLLRGLLWTLPSPLLLSPLQLPSPRLSLCSFPPVRTSVGAPPAGLTVPVGTPVFASGWFCLASKLVHGTYQGPAVSGTRWSPAGRQHLRCAVGGLRGVGTHILVLPGPQTTAPCSSGDHVPLGVSLSPPDSEIGPTSPLSFGPAQLSARVEHRRGIAGQ